ncbi:MAG TPA: nucleotidyltransferase domain-containing protein [Chloroflexota bacterium]
MGDVVPPLQHANITSLTARYLQLADEALPGRIEGLYIVGSVALGDYQAGRSDIDFVTVLRSELSSEELAAVERVHRLLGIPIPKPWFDGIYVTWEDLTRNPQEITVAPHTHEGRFERSRGFEANPSVWITLGHHSHAIRGPAPPAVWHDVDVVRSWNVGNLNSYWRGLVKRGRQFIPHIGDHIVEQAVVWCVPGVSRMHYTIATGDTISKADACRYALAMFPERWHTLIGEAQALQAGERPSRRPARSRQHELADFMEFVINDANAVVPVEGASGGIQP